MKVDDDFKKHFFLLKYFENRILILAFINQINMTDESFSLLIETILFWNEALTSK